MSSLTLNPTSMNALMRKDVSEISIPTFKGDLSYEDALKAIATYDTLVKEVSKGRKPELKNYFCELQNYHLAKGPLLTAVAVAAEIGMMLTGVIDAGVSTPGVGEVLLAGGTCIGGLALSLVTSVSNKMVHALSPIKAKKMQETYEIEKAMLEMKDTEFTEAEAKILKKAKKSIKVINEHLKYENRKVVYSNTKGKEGFTIETIAPLNAWEEELLRLEKMKATNTAIGTGSLKELTA